MIHRRRRWFAVLLGVVVYGVACIAEARPQVVVTIDVESLENHPLPSQVDPVCDDGIRCGLMEIVRMMNDRHVAGTFFLNVYEHPLYGEDALRKIAVDLEAAGQDVELHTHPETAYDRNRSEMYQYSLDEQTEIIRDGIRRLESWTGKKVVAHRAGAYGADEQTLIALERNGIVWDSSMFFTHPKSRLDALGMPRNLPWRHGELTEIPVTVYERDDRPGFLGDWLAPVRVVRKIDVDWAITEQEARDSVDAVVAADLPVLIVFLHSFSFMAEDAGDGKAIADRHSIEMFRAILDQIAKQGLAVATLREIATRGLPAAPPVADVVPRVAVDVDLAHYAWRRSKTVDRTVLLGGLGTFAAVLVAAIAWAVMRMRRWGLVRSAAAGAGQRGEVANR